MLLPNKAFMYKAVPKGWPKAGEDLTVETSDFDDSVEPPANGLTTKNLYATFDPSQRFRMRDPAIKSYSAAMQIGLPVIAVHVMGKVLKSNHPDFSPEDIVILTPWSTESYSTIPESSIKSVKLVHPAPDVPLTAYLGVLGMTGMTAWGSLHEIGQPKKDDTILVSAAAGAVGQTVGQIAVREGLNVIGSVGSDEKLDYIKKELGFAAGFNYKKESPIAALQRLAPDGIDIYYDNVGGEMLDAALASMKEFGRIVACGSISTHAGEIYPVKNYSQMVRKRIRWQGFLVYDPNIEQHRKARDDNITKWLAEGSFKTIDHVTDGMDNATEGFLGMLKGENLGKSILKISDG